MARYHKATLTPSKADLISAWLPTQPWCPNPDAAVEVLGAYRFDDPDGQVGMEAHLVAIGDTLVHVPLTYRDVPVEDAGAELVGEMHHSALGDRWLYDGLTDSSFLTMLAGVSLTGQGEALGMVVLDGQWHIAPTNVRIRGGGWSLERLSVDGFILADSSVSSPTYQNQHFSLTAHRLPEIGPQPELGLTASWADGPGDVVLAEVTAL